MQELTEKLSEVRSQIYDLLLADRYTDAKKLYNEYKTIRNCIVALELFN